MPCPLTQLNPSRILTTAFVALLALCLAADAHAQSTNLSARKQPTRIAVIGDSVANDLGRGFQDLFENKPNVEIVKQTKFATGLVRTDYYDWNGTVRKFLKEHNPDVILVVIGGNDRQAIRVNGQRYEPFEKGWVVDYERRVARFMKNFKGERAQVYWVSLPPVRSEKLTNAFREMNKIYRRQAERHGFHYLNVWNRFLTKGAYSSFGQSLEGVRRQIRKDDGMHFTEAGRILFASYVANAIGLR